MTPVSSPEVTDELRDALRLAGSRTLSQIRKSGTILYQKKKHGEDIELEFFDLLVYLISDSKKSGNALGIVSKRNYSIQPEERQISDAGLIELEKKAYQFLTFELQAEAAENNPIPEDYQHLARVTPQGTIALEYQAISDHLLKLFKVVSYVGGGDSEGIDGDGDGTPDLYVYNDTTGIYARDTSTLKNEITRIAEAVQFKAQVTGATKEIFHYLAYDSPERVYPFNNEDGLIPCLNGIIDIRSGEPVLIPHSPEHKFTCAIPVKFDPEADPGPIDQILRDYVSGDYVGYLYQIPAQALLQGFCRVSPYKKSYLIQGAGNGGKSTYCDLLVKWLFSTRFVGNECLQDLCGGNRFASSSLPDKFLNLFDDLDDMGSLQNVGKFKTLSGSFNHSIEVKGQPRKNAKIFCPHVFTCNRPPVVNNSRIKTDVAWWDRWNYIRFEDSEFTADPSFQERNFTPENMSGFLNKVLEYVISIRKDPKQFRRMDYEAVLSNWDATSDPITAFINECFDPTPGEVFKYDKNLMVEAYIDYCKVTGIGDIHNIKTPEKLTRKFNEGEHPFTIGRGGGKWRPYIYQAHLRWNGFKDIFPPTHYEIASQSDLNSYQQ